ncbi:MAG: DUF6129 family protein [Pseudomonadota bacterium]
MIDVATLEGVAARAGEIDLSEAGMAHLRREWPGIHFTFCGEDDVPARLKPAHEGQGFHLYLVSNASHCVAFTSEPDAATGIVVATIDDE